MSGQGKRYNQNKPRWSLMSYEAMLPMIKVLEYGAHKYTIYEDANGEEIKGADIPYESRLDYKVKISGIDNWKKGFPKREVLDCMQRHLAAMIDGEDDDNESKEPHLGHLMCNAMFYSYILIHNPLNESE